MPRQFRKQKPYIVVFCEGESEQVYTDFLRDKFKDVAVIRRPKATGLFEEAQDRFNKDPKFRNNAEVTDEIWFFFDVETKDIASWNKRYRIMKFLRRQRKKPNIRVRLLMTSGCIEYWLMLHYKMTAPPLQTKAEKEQMISELKRLEPGYVKGDKKATEKIAEYYPTAVTNAAKTMKNLLPEGLPGLEDTDERNEWLCKNCKTFSNVHEAINFLSGLRIS